MIQPENILKLFQISSVTQSWPTLCKPKDWIIPSFPVDLQIPDSCHVNLTSIASVMPSNHLVLSCSLLLRPSIFPSTRVFSNELVLHIRWPNYWSFSFNFSPSNEYSGLVRIDWLDLLVVQETVKSPRQHHSSKISILQCSAFFTVQLSHPYMTTGKTIALTRPTFVGYIGSIMSQAI